MSFDINGDVLVKYTGDDKEVVIPEGVITIEENAFAGSRSLEHVTIGETVKYIKSRAFAECENLSKIDFLGTIKEIDGLAFEKCKTLNEITLPRGIEMIKYGTFEGCESLKHVNIPEGVKEIDFMAFCGSMSCVPIEELILPDSVEYLGNSNISKGGYYKNSEDVLFKRVHLGKGLKTIGSFDRNYYEFDNIEFDSDFSIVFDKKYSGPEDDDPYSSKVYTDFSLDTANPYYLYEDGFLLSKDGKILYSCLIDNVDEIIVPDGVEKIMGHAFSNVMCSKIVIPGTVTDMRGSFVYAKIGTLVLSEGITDIQSYAFLKSDINELILPNSLKKMEGLAFMDVNKLKTLKLPCNNFSFGKFQMYDRGPKEGKTPFWFDPKAGFNDLEYVELIDEERNVLSRMGMPSEKEQRQVKEEYHSVLDDFIESKGNPSGIKRLYGHLKNKTSKLQLLYGVLSSESINDDKVKKALLPDIIKNKKILIEMAADKEDERTIAIIEELVAANKKK